MNGLPVTKKEEKMSVRNAAKRITSVMTAASLSLALLMSSGPAFADAGFRQWVAGFRATAVEEGVSGTVYDKADKYALAVGLLADEIGGSSGLVQDWKRPFTKLTFEERQELQKRLSQHGLYDGKFDGKIGDGSKNAIMAFQAKAGLTQDGYPSMEVLKWLRQK